MKIQSMQFKVLMTVISAMLAITVFIGGLCIYELDQFVQHQTEDYINVTCEKDASQINDIFGGMEKSVHIMESNVLGLINSKEDVEDTEKQNGEYEHHTGGSHGADAAAAGDIAAEGFDILQNVYDAVLAGNEEGCQNTGNGGDENQGAGGGHPLCHNRRQQQRHRQKAEKLKHIDFAPIVRMCQ